MEIKNIGVKVEKPKGKSAGDKKSPFTGNISVRGRTFVGTVISDSMNKTVTVEWDRRRDLKKYQRYEKRRSKVKAHNPPEVNAQKGDVVKIMETRPLSKTKHFVVIEVMGKEKGFLQRMEGEAESKSKHVRQQEDKAEDQNETKSEEKTDDNKKEVAEDTNASS